VRNRDPSLILILSDINMPGMSGLELLPKAKALRPDVPVIMITAYGDAETKRKASTGRGTPRHVGNQVMNELPAGIAKMTFVEPVRHKLGSVAQTVTFAPSLCRHLDFSAKASTY
jgi:CheY-like chemotaxis protein